LVKIERSVQAIVVIFVVLGMCLVYVGHQASVAQEQLDELERRTNTIVDALQGMQETLQVRVSELENLIVECGITIDNGTVATTETLYLTKGATALEALRRVAVVETTYYTGLGEFINKINGVGAEAGKYWAFYYWSENNWGYASVGAGSYKVKDADNIKFVYASW
jgi:hypothetical protein